MEVKEFVTAAFAKRPPETDDDGWYERYSFYQSVVAHASEVGVSETEAVAIARRAWGMCGANPNRVREWENDAPTHSAQPAQTAQPAWYDATEGAINCPHCQNTRLCPHCGGDGLVFDPSPNEEGNLMTCPSCGGAKYCHYC